MNAVGCIQMDAVTAVALSHDLVMHARIGNRYAPNCSMWPTSWVGTVCVSAIGASWPGTWSQ